MEQKRSAYIDKCAFPGFLMFWTCRTVIMPDSRDTYSAAQCTLTQDIRGKMRYEKDGTKNKTF